MDGNTLLQILKEGLPYAIADKDQLKTALAIIGELETVLTRVVGQRDQLVTDNHRLKVDKEALEQSIRRLEDNLDLLDGELENASLSHMELLLDLNYWTISDRKEIVELIRQVRSDDQTKLTNIIEDTLAYEKQPLSIEELVAALMENETDLMSDQALNTLIAFSAALKERRESIKVSVANERP